MVVGITSSIACGKSLVSNYLKQKNYKVIDSDLISHKVLLLKEVKEQLIKLFSNDIISNNEIDRKKLGSIVFNDKNKKELLSKTVFPYILNEIKNQINQYSNNKIIFLDAPLLIEYNILYLVNKVIVIKLDEDKQIQRLISRDCISKEYAINKIKSQLPLKEKLNYADYIIDNNYSIENTYKQIEDILKELEENYEN